jgi:hypothetical protein
MINKRARSVANKGTLENVRITVPKYHQTDAIGNLRPQKDDLWRESSLPWRERTRSRSLWPSPAGGGDWLRGRFLDAPRGLEAADSMAMGAVAEAAGQRRAATGRQVG